MKFNRRARLDTSQVSDRRRMRAGPAAVGGVGGLGIIGVLLFLFLGGGGGGLDSVLGGLDGVAVDGAQQGPSEVEQECRSGADAEQRQDCRIVAVVNSVQAYWEETLSTTYPPAATVFFTDAVDTGCGRAGSAVGPFYCPADSQVYVDLGFFDELEDRFGAPGDFAEAYVIAHEYGHHVQNVLGLSDQVGRSGETGPASPSVRLELQADCLAGAWAAHASRTDGLIVELTEQDVSEALDAAAAVGDDRIQEQAEGRVSPESWTHGASEQREGWFRTGYETGDPGRCDTFSVADDQL